MLQALITYTDIGMKRLVTKIANTHVKYESILEKDRFTTNIIAYKFNIAHYLH